MSGPRPFRVRALTLDATGTLLHAPRLGELYREVLRRHGLGVTADAAEVGEVVRRVWQEMACVTDGSTDRFSTHPEGARGWWRRFAERVAEHLGAGEPSPFATTELFERFARPDAWEPFPDARPALAELRARGLALAVVANWDERLPPVLEGLGLAEHLDAVVVSAAVGYEKPDPRAFLAALARLGELYREVLRRHGLAVTADAAEVGEVVRRVWQEMACVTDGSTDRFSTHPEGARGWWRRFAERVAEHLGSGEPSPFATTEL
ncbi:MAG TPA: HAD family hydrolase, partial [Thermoanaerobaculia bacterium]